MTYGEIEALKQDLAGLAAHLAHLQAHFGKVCEQQAAHLRDHFDRELQDIRGHLRQVEERLATFAEDHQRTDGHRDNPEDLRLARSGSHAEPRQRNQREENDKSDSTSVHSGQVRYASPNRQEVNR